MTANEIVNDLRSPDRCNECVFNKSGSCYWGEGTCLNKHAADCIERLQKELEAAKADLKVCNYCFCCGNSGSSFVPAQKEDRCDECRALAAKDWYINKPHWKWRSVCENKEENI